MKYPFVEFVERDKWVQHCDVGGDASLRNWIVSTPNIRHDVFGVGDLHDQCCWRHLGSLADLSPAFETRVLRPELKPRANSEGLTSV